MSRVRLLPVCAMVIAPALLIACGDSTERPAAAPEPVLTDEVPPPPEGPAGLMPAFVKLPDFAYPTALLQAPGDTSRWFVLEQEGRLRSFANAADAHEAPVVLDIRDAVVGPKVNWESGLVGIAFHPRFESTRHLYLFYVTHSTTSPVGSKWVLSRFTWPRGAAQVDRASELVILSRDNLDPAYNGGTLAFAADGTLYVSTGQNAPNDTEPHPSQDPFDLAGSLLRIDVDRGTPYAIPPDNPFVAGGGAPEVYAYGFRNPWKFSIDSETGRIWVGDVGNHGWEEIDIALPGRNYGWSRVEGDQCRDDCPADYEPPVYAYPGPHASVIAGGVYRGAAIPELQGVFLFADFMRAELWGLFPAAGVPADGPVEASGDWEARRLLRTRNALRSPRLIGSITTFGVDSDGEFLTMSRAGRIHRLAPRDELARYYMGLSNAP